MLQAMCSVDGCYAHPAFWYKRLLGGLDAAVCREHRTFIEETERKSGMNAEAVEFTPFSEVELGKPKGDWVESSD